MSSNFISDGFVYVSCSRAAHAAQELSTHSELISIPLGMAEVSVEEYDPKIVIVGDRVHVFSRSAQAWWDGEVVNYVDGRLQVQYLCAFADGLVQTRCEDGKFLCRKTMHMSSNHLVPSSMIVAEELANKGFTVRQL